mmetsp:Transcript_1358/g.4441  ORF Transcript_1358/g.4441 Transcript_1358/m.4441 type:complete len:123 (+) Transcript_1358:135-503(+)
MIRDDHAFQVYAIGEPCLRCISLSNSLYLHNSLASSVLSQASLKSCALSRTDSSDGDVSDCGDDAIRDVAAQGATDRGGDLCLRGMSSVCPSGAFNRSGLPVRIADAPSLNGNWRLRTRLGD